MEAGPDYRHFQQILCPRDYASNASRGVVLSTQLLVGSDRPEGTTMSPSTYDYEGLEAVWSVRHARDVFPRNCLLQKRVRWI